MVIAESYCDLILILDEATTSCTSVEIYFNFVQARPTFLSGKVGKTIVTHKTCSLLAFNLCFAETAFC